MFKKYIFSYCFRFIGNSNIPPFVVSFKEVDGENEVMVHLSGSSVYKLSSGGRNITVRYIILLQTFVLNGEFANFLPLWI